MNWLIARFAVCLAVGLALAGAEARAAPASLERLDTVAQFDALAATVSVGRYARFPRVMFVIDRAAKPGAKLYFINTRRYVFHIPFVRARTLSVQDEVQLLEASYSRPDRRFVFGSVVRYPALDRYGVEFWEGDILDARLLRDTMSQLGANFPRPLAFKPNSQSQIALAETLPDIAAIPAGAVYGSSSGRVLNPGKAVGRLRILSRIEDAKGLKRTDIVLLDEVPLALPPVAGVILTRFSSPLSHVHLLAKSWRVPDVAIPAGRSAYASLDGSAVMLSARGDSVELRAATTAEIARAEQARANGAVRIASADLNYRALPALVEQGAVDALRIGAKAANLGEVARRLARRPGGFEVPPGFAVPFAWYADFVRANGIDRRIDALLADKALREDPDRLNASLAQLRAAFAAAPFDQGLLVKVAARRDAVIGPGGVFVRSSTNSEDLQGFNGAGLYTTVPNVVGNAALASAIKAVWGSIWNDAAFAAREAAGIDHRSVMAAVLVQRGMNADAAGVMITENPFEPEDEGSVFINAKRGLGIRTVEGRRVAEQLLYRADTDSVQVLTRSTDDGKLVFDANGGVRELPVEPGRAVLTDALARRLALAGTLIARWFGGQPQDIEWLMIGETLYVVQSRPYLRGN